MTEADYKLNTIIKIFKNMAMFQIIKLTLLLLNYIDMKRLLIFTLFLTITNLFAQKNLYMPKEIKAAYENKSRSITGEAGENYFQNSAVYNIDAEFNPQTGLLNGRGNIVYKNNSSNPLKQIVFMLYPNLYKKGITRNFDIEAQDVGQGMEIKSIKINGEDAKSKTYGTLLIVDLENELEPGGNISFETVWSYNFPMETLIREGRYLDSTYFVAYWYPHIVVYDDLRGWDRHKYNGEQEFYNDNADYSISIKVPKDYLVWASGELQNPNQVYSDFVLKKIEKAYSEDEVVNIVTKKNITKKKFTQQSDYNSWKFSSTSIPDFAFCLSNNFLWDATSVDVSGKRIKVNAVYNPNSIDFHEVASLSAQSIKRLSEEVMNIDYPYPILTAFNGHYGMEFPMMINDGDGANHNETVFITAHEIGHSWFPFLVGTNEHGYAWMDEGLITYLPKQVEDSLSSEENYRSLSGTLNTYSYFAGSGFDLPMMIPSEQLTGRTYMYVSYNRSAIAFYVLEDILGSDVFDECMTAFIKRWTGKHPTAYDFFFTFNDVSDKNLNWFWEPWFFNFGYADLAITGFHQQDSTTTINIKNEGGFPTPIYLKLSYEDGSEKLIYKSASVWENEQSEFEVSFATNKALKSVSIDHLYSPDAIRDNNVHTMDME